jgi:hypothetical protein
MKRFLLSLGRCFIGGNNDGTMSSMLTTVYVADIGVTNCALVRFGFVH